MRMSWASFAGAGRVIALLLLLLPPLPGLAGEAEVRAFASLLGLRDVEGFVATVTSLREDGDLPERYLTKSEARRLGWRPGRDLCRSDPKGIMGGDRFGNRERRLPDKPGRIWYEADLDFACGRRGARRLVFSSDGLVFVTLDHYETFKEVPP
ncbi:ribonuclease domain-containing protein [Geminicoccaceae bacterium 1502E]|nr:ribonuclease domain-containing protein [Geminicoccaceae bacterium 1502E]